MPIGDNDENDQGPFINDEEDSDEDDVDDEYPNLTIAVFFILSSQTQLQ